MAEMVDSKKQRLNSFDIVHIAMENTKTPYPPQVALSGIMAELSQPTTVVNIFGNTLFSLFNSKNSTGYFKALNADTASNYVENSRKFMALAKQKGYTVLITQFTDPSLLNLIKASVKIGLPAGTGYKVFRNAQNVYTVAFQLNAMEI